MIEVANLAKIYPNQRGLKGISFSVSQGEILGLLGPNGAGKTTTMRLMTGFLYPTSGTVTIGEYNIFDHPEAIKKQIGYLPENPPLYSEMSVTGYLEFVARLKGVKPIELETEVNRVVELTGLDGVTQQLIGSLSKGYKQRVGLAQALLNSPPVLILDEPTAGLDPKQIIEIRNLIKNLAKEHTVILSSHILPEVNMICGRVVIIDQGHLVAIDTPEGLASQMASGQRIEIEAKGTETEIEKLLKSVKELKSWSYLGPQKSHSGGEPNHRFQLNSQDKGDLRETLFKTFAGSSVPLLEMHSVNLSLEEIFLHLTTTENPETVSEPVKKEVKTTTKSRKVGVSNHE